MYIMDGHKNVHIFADNYMDNRPRWLYVDPDVRYQNLLFLKDQPVLFIVRASSRPSARKA